MENYADRDNNSGVKTYEIGNDYIIVEFKAGRNRFYKYTYNSAGSSNVEEMKKLAEAGDGLNRFIAKNEVSYDSKW